MMPQPAPFCMQFLEGFTEDSFFTAPVPPLKNSFHPACRHKIASCSWQPGPASLLCILFFSTMRLAMSN